MLARLLIALILAAGAFSARAAAWIDLRYDAGPDARLDIHAPSDAGPHRVLVWLHGGRWRQGDKLLLDQQVAQVTARGYVLVSVAYPDAPARHPAQIEHAAAALAYVVGNIARYGGDPQQIRLMGAEAGAQLAAMLAVDPRWLGRHGLAPAILKGVVLIDADGLDLVARMRTADGDAGVRAQVWGNDPQQWAEASPLLRLSSRAGTPAVLLVDRRDADPAQALRRERFADRLRSVGVAGQIFLRAKQTAVSAGTSWPGLDDRSRDAVFAWMDASALPRLARFENLEFETDFLSGIEQAGALLRGAEVPFLFAFGGRLWAALSDVDARSGEPARIIGKRSADGDWAPVHGFGAGLHFTALSGWRFSRDGEGRALTTSAAVLVAGLAGTSGARWSWALVDGKLGTLAAAAPPLRAAQLHRDLVSGADVLLLGAAGGGIRSAVWQGGTATLRLQPGNELEGADVVAMAVANGRAYAMVAGINGGLYERIDGSAPSWQRVAVDADAGGASVAALSTVPDPGGTGRDALLAAYAPSGHIVRIDPHLGFRRSLEVDLGAAFAEVWQGTRPPVQFGGNGFVSLRHPETADQVHAIGLRLSHPQSAQPPHNGAWYVVRQHDGSYSYGMSYDYAGPPAPGRGLGAVRAIAASPFVADRPGALYFSGFDGRAGDRDNAWIYRGGMPGVQPRRGLWWDRLHSGHGLDLQPVGNRWMLNLATYDETGKPVWYAAVGDIIESTFIADGGLSRYRYALDRDPPQRRDAARSGEVSIHFGLEHGQGVCAGSASDRPDAEALAELSLRIDGRDVHWCIEPMRFAEAGVPGADANGLWYAGPADAGWGVSIAEHGVDGRSLGVAHLYYYDAAGEPRWALGTAPVVDGNARYALRSFSGYCAGCEPKPITSVPAGEFVQRLSGVCAEVSGFGSLDVQAPGDGDSRFLRSRFPMNRVSRAACY